MIKEPRLRVMVRDNVGIFADVGRGCERAAGEMLEALLAAGALLPVRM